MINILTLVFSDFQINTYIVYDQTNECVIIDPGCYYSEEETILKETIKTKNLKPVHLLNTHTHLDHVFGNKFVSDTFNLGSEACFEDEVVLNSFEFATNRYGLTTNKPYSIKKYLKEGDIIKFGNSELEVLEVPGHTPGHLAFVNRNEKIAFVGDVLFSNSIGRTDLPGGNHKQLIESIKNKLYTLPEETVVYSGHGPTTSIEKEKCSNPFVKQ